MNKKTLRKYFNDAVEKEKIHPFETIRPLLKREDKRMPEQLKAAFIFYTLFICLSASVIAAGITQPSFLTEHIVSEYRVSNFSLHAREKIKKAERYLTHLRKLKKGEL
jgi:hypothetical protein